MKILHVCPLYSPSVGGNQRHIEVLSKRLADLGHDVHVFTVNALFHNEFPENPLPPKEIIDGVTVHRFKNNLWLRDFVVHRIFKVRGGYRLCELLFPDSAYFWAQGPVVFRMLWGMVRLRPDIIMTSNNVFFTNYLCVLAKRLFGMRFFVAPLTHVCDRQIGHPDRLAVLKQADGVFAFTEFERALLVKIGVPCQKIHTFPLGIPILKENRIAGDGHLIRKGYGIIDAPVVAYVGRKVDGKGIIALIDAMKGVWKERPDCRLLIAGQGERSFVEVMQRHIDQYKTEEQGRIINIDSFTEEEKDGIYGEIDILAMPSNSDAFGLVYLEAWAHSKPVIACKHMPQESIIRDGHDGLLVDYDDRVQLSQAILKLVEDPLLRTEMGKNGRKSLETKYNIDLYVRNTLASYETVLGKK